MSKSPIVGSARSGSCPILSDISPGRALFVSAEQPPLSCARVIFRRVPLVSSGPLRPCGMALRSVAR